jgi:opacity protein-like surface antigen
MTLVLAGILGASTLPLVAAAPASSMQDPDGQTDSWSFDVVPYLWIATYGGTFDLPGAPPGIGQTKSASSDPFSTHISAAAMLMGQVRYKDVGLFLDGAWLQLKTEGDLSSDLYSGVDIKSSIGFGTMALTYRLAPMGKLKTDLLAGARIWHVSTTMDFEAGTAAAFSTDASKNWYDPIVGANLRYDFSKRWYAVVLGDAGGFGAGSKLEWEVFGGVGYEFTSWFSTTLGYRYMHMNYDKDQFKMDVGVQGFLLGIGFHF